jgi:hypothetical protein
LEELMKVPPWSPDGKGPDIDREAFGSRAAEGCARPRIVLE